MGKYIIDTDQFTHRFKPSCIGVYGIGKDIDNMDEKVVWSRMVNIDDLDELNADYINEHFSDLQDTAYQRCQIELIVAIRELIKHDNSNDWKEMGFEFDFGTWSYRLMEIFRNHEPSEIIEKVKAYDQKQTRRNIESDLDYLMQSTGMTIDEIATGLKGMVE